MRHTPLACRTYACTHLYKGTNHCIKRQSQYKLLQPLSLRIRSKWPVHSCTWKFVCKHLKLTFPVFTVVIMLMPPRHTARLRHRKRDAQRTKQLPNMHTCRILASERYRGTRVPSSLQTELQERPYFEMRHTHTPRCPLMNRTLI